MTKMICDLSKENERLRGELRDKASLSSTPEPTGEGCLYQRRFEALKLLFDDLNAENRQVKDESVDLKVCVSRLQERKAFLENEIMRLAGVVEAQKSAMDSLERRGLIHATRFTQQTPVTRASTSANNVRFIKPCHPDDELWQLQQH
ncbi:uncharacterized protein LOC114543664 [Dendronephthya gigantea]|uniref:uncharacterized protein LOC114543664 n=1 Tax=Dendronephthya gigantea TaxID=151771 RepID=UPI001068ED9A|nr:uncharacterized protein LOC114543664 [Dendronephthya gigantea]